MARELAPAGRRSRPKLCRTFKHTKPCSSWRSLRPAAQQPQIEHARSTWH